jgi:hypothetical protein
LKTSINFCQTNFKRIFGDLLNFGHWIISEFKDYKTGLCTGLNKKEEKIDIHGLGPILNLNKMLPNTQMPPRVA